MRATSEARDGAFLDEVEQARTAARQRFRHAADHHDEAPAKFDPDNPPFSDERLSRLRPAAEVHPGLVAASLRRKAGRPKADVTKKAVSIRLDLDVVEALKAEGTGWQTRANALLRASLGLAP